MVRFRKRLESDSSFEKKFLSATAERDLLFVDCHFLVLKSSRLSLGIVLGCVRTKEVCQ
jgi:hypothetical protein